MHTMSQFLGHHHYSFLLLNRSIYQFIFPWVYSGPKRFDWFRSPWQQTQAFFCFSHAVMGNKTVLAPQGRLLVRTHHQIEAALLQSSFSLFRVLFNHTCVSTVFLWSKPAVHLTIFPVIIFPVHKIKYSLFSFNACICMLPVLFSCLCETAALTSSRTFKLHLNPSAVTCSSISSSSSAVTVVLNCLGGSFIYHGDHFEQNTQPHWHNCCQRMT